MNWLPAGYVWNEVPTRFGQAKRDDEAAGGDGLDTTIVFQSPPDFTLTEVLRVLPEPLRLIAAEGLAGAFLDTMTPPSAVCAVHWGGELNDLAFAALVAPAGAAVRYATEGDDHWLDVGRGTIIGTAEWIREDLCHKVGWGLGFWPSRKRY